ncbi:hypothetical protein Sta7437_1905 [Stanieria cyanosphaera PCC 7437]|uniref:DUF3037 domain-containing protein n=1 Tax=Stanieria cyanosphaera (strain ATCC 29371 / PCC 7437) TaxID=111780 RepID=K9XTQ9_STAC7|nr:DUF3037 domain-containing protein [Stanieria cyanosphaera]AFZ35461.1 hypothetical protein Sta7437_1905 [Stanieria cyanosphaera PCC 7437]
MASRYSIVQYVPNPIADERINIGIVAFNERLVRTRFLKSWKRVRHFAIEDKDIDFLQEFKTHLQKSTSLGLLFSENIEDRESNYERLNKIAQSWGNSIQFTEPRGSLDDPDTLLENIFDILLIEPITSETPFRDRQAAAKIATRKVKKVLEKFGEEAKNLLKKDYKLAGHYAKHKFDVAVANGRPFFAAQAISFEIQTTEQLINSTSWMIADVKEIQPATPLAVIVLPPKEESPHYKQLQATYQETMSTYASLGAEIVQENEIEAWTSERLDKELISL